MDANGLIPDNSAMAQRFVLHRHETDRSHLELGIALPGRLAYWRLGGGLSLDTTIRLRAERLADRPLEYLMFEGLALSLDCGAGPLSMIDTGRLHNHSLDERGRPVELDAAVDAGEVRIWLEGTTFQGGWDLTRAGELWELVKVGDVVALARAAVHSGV